MALRVVYATDLSENSKRCIDFFLKYRNFINEVLIVRVIDRLELADREGRYSEEKILEAMDFLNDQGIKCD